MRRLDAALVALRSRRATIWCATPERADDRAYRWAAAGQAALSQLLHQDRSPATAMAAQPLHLRPCDRIRKVVVPPGRRSGIQLL